MNLAPAYEQWYAQTIEEGKQLGLSEGEERRGSQIARRLLQKNMPVEEIAELTGLSLAQIQALQTEDHS